MQHFATFYCITRLRNALLTNSLDACIVRGMAPGGTEDMEKDDADTTAPHDVDSGLQMAASPDSALSATSVTAKDLLRSNRCAVTSPGASTHQGMLQLLKISAFLFSAVKS